jgi:hypothetical protein
MCQADLTFVAIIDADGRVLTIAVASAHPD